MRLFGVNEVALRFPSIALSTLAIYFTFYIGSSIFETKVGLLAAYFHSIHGFLIEIAAGKVPTDHVDTLFVFWVELGILLSVVYIRKKHIFFVLLMGIAAGLAILTKWLSGLIVLPVCFVLMWKQETLKNLLLKMLFSAIVCVAVFLPWQMYIRNSFPVESSWESHYNVLQLLKPLEGHSGSWYYYLVRLPQFFGELIYLPIAWFLFTAIREHNYGWASVVIWFSLPYVFFSVVATKMRAML
jgi:4-amino-4-deoxy-L-arabinose transferase